MPGPASERQAAARPRTTPCCSEHRAVATFDSADARAARLVRPVRARSVADPSQPVFQLPYRFARAPLFSLDPEAAHALVVRGVRTALATSPARALARSHFSVDAPELRVRRWGIEFDNPVGLAAGFDKNGAAINPLAALGFGFIEIGTVTARAQPGNPRPRLFRLPADRALLNRMGFNNEGAAAVAARLRARSIEPVVGINIGKSRAVALEDAVADHLRSVTLLSPFARYLVLNVSSPNTPGLRSLQESEPLAELLDAVVLAARGLPVLVKLAPDLTDAAVERAVATAVDHGAAGIIAVNTTVSRDGLRTSSGRLERLGSGGISGAPLRRRATDVVALIRRATAGAVPIIGVGGIFDADDAWDRIRAGASLLQVYTGLVYQGPEIARTINLGLLERLRREGASSVHEVVGSAVR